MLFNRKKYKRFALQQLKSRWIVPIMMTIISGLIMIIFSIPEIVSMIKTIAKLGTLTIDFEDANSINIAIQTIKSTRSTSDLLTYIQYAVEAILSIAGVNVYLKMSRSPAPVSLSDFFEGLNNWLRGIFAYFWMYLWTCLWTLLFIIPGFIKAIAYSQTIFIVAEYKNISIPKALRISNLITKGYKGDLFVMYLSFLGWYLLALLPAGLGLIFLRPYSHMSFVNAYHALMQEALETGKLRPEDLQND